MQSWMAGWMDGNLCPLKLVLKLTLSSSAAAVKPVAV
jgi:hypothetical protein